MPHSIAGPTMNSRMLLGFRYVKERSSLLVEVQQVIQLVAGSSAGGQLKPYVQLKLLPDTDKKKHRTDSVKSSDAAKVIQ